VKRRGFLVGTAAAASALLWWLRPGDEGAPYDDYFRALNEELRRNGHWRPSLILDLDRLDHNLAQLRASIRAPKHYRVVAKSLPSLPLLDYVMKAAMTNRLMAFHQPFLNIEAQAFPQSDILLGKPMPAGAAAAFYREHRGAFDPARQLQWLLDTPERLRDYLELAQGLDVNLRVNIEIDVGLHRGGVTSIEMLKAMLDLIDAHPRHLRFAGFMGYDPHVVKLPRPLGSRESLLAKVRDTYRGYVDYARREHAALWSQGGVTLNGAGSPTFRLYEQDDLLNDLAAGSCLVKPTDFDLDTLTGFQPALFIATPILKAADGVRLPGLEALSPALSVWNPNWQRSYFLYGGHWMARYEAPRGLRANSLYGQSSNQELANGSAKTALAVNDHAFLRPTQSEALMLQFGDLLVLRGGRLVDRWPVLQQSRPAA
jgi:D-serine deaminase-like pyridoxal phosphate-dependent protein